MKHPLKIEIDIATVVGDPEHLRQNIADILATRLSAGMQKEISARIFEALNTEITKAIGKHMPKLIASVLDDEFQPVDRYGDRSEKTTFRKELIKKINSEMQYKNARYDSDKNIFTRAVDGFMEEHPKTFREEFKKAIDAQYTNAVMVQAAEQLKRKLGLA